MRRMHFNKTVSKNSDRAVRVRVGLERGTSYTGGPQDNKLNFTDGQ